MEAHLVQWLELAARWLHVIAGAAWIGTSFYFNWLNHSLGPPLEPRPGVAGELWSVHGGGFYRVEKFSAAPERLPDRLHWFKWEAYFTWITGALLLVLIYYLGSGAYLRDPAVSGIGQPAAVLIGAGTLIVGLLLYDALCRTPLAERPIPFVLVLLVLVAVFAFGLGQFLSARAAFIHVGAMVGTWMAANVFFVIIPGQRAMVTAMEAGLSPDARRGREGALRSLHNNYLTLPVLFLMVGIHHPAAYAHPQAWVILIAMALIGVAARHYYNLRHRGRHVVWILPAVAAAMVILALVTMPRRPAGGRAPAAVTEAGESYAVVRAILEERCVACHSAHPEHPDWNAAPLGVAFDTPAQVHAQAGRIGGVVAMGTMPLGNVTGMTSAERELIVRWANGATRIE
ncbi:urate hydroxylase PuuD [soil metagenome]